MRSLLSVYRFFRPDWLRVLVALAMLAGVVVAGVMRPWPMAWLVDCALGTKPWPPALTRWVGDEASGRIVGLCGLLVGIHLAYAGLQAGLSLVLIQTGLRGLARVRQAVFDWLLGLSPRELQKRPMGDLIYRATWDTYSFQTLFQQGLFTALSALASVLVMVGVMWQLNLRLTLAALLVVPPLLLVMQFFGRRMSTRAGISQGAEARLATLVQQALTLLPLIQSHTAEGRTSKEFRSAAEQTLLARGRQHRTEIVYLALVAALFAVATGLLLWLGAQEVVAGRLTVGALWVFLTYLTQLYEPLNQLGHLGGTVSQARAGVQRVTELLEVTDPVTGTQPVTAEMAGRDLEFQNVYFGYTPDRPVLRGLSVKIPAGATVALIGPSGAGKSTLLQMIPRFLEPDAGKILLGGLGLNDLDRRSLRENIAWVLQEPLLLPASLAENLAYGRPGATRAEIEAAAKAAEADDFIRRSAAGYDSVVGDGGLRLSVGEKQRLNLARALVKNAPILLLDEPTSALDGISERAVLRALRTLRRGRTTVMVAHRRETIQDVDLVLVLVDGLVVEAGSPAELRQRDGYLTRLWEHTDTE